MDESRRERLKRILVEAAGATDSERAAMLERVRLEDPELAAEAESLATQRTRGELEGRGLAAALAESIGSADEPDPITGSRRVGPYRLVGLLGTGGMGAVYRAIQEKPLRREVAVKLLRTGHDPATLLARFEAERQAMALVDHPGIANILDAGEDDSGTPYLVIELVQGTPITSYCRLIPRTAALGVFVSVCRAVQHAHQKGIIHRDLKPSNILVSVVDGRPHVKVIDFGIARIVSEGEDERRSLTGEGQVVGTLEYMSPEQAMGRSRDVDTRSDVYSLGAVLYELLTGELPHDFHARSLAEAIEIIRRDPPRPFRQTASGRRPDADLETVTRKALEIEPDRRYDGAGALADDIERYLRSEPITARPQSTAYQIRKLVARHRAATTVGGGVIVLLAAFAVAMSTLYAAKQREADHARAAAAEAEAVNEFLRETLSSADPFYGNPSLTVRQVLDRAAATAARRGADAPEVLGAVQLTLGAAYRGVGDLARSDSLLKEAVRVIGRAHGSRSLEAAAALRELAATSRDRGQLRDADSLALSSLRIVDVSPGATALVRLRGLDELGQARTQIGDAHSAESLLTEAVRIGRRVLSRDDPRLAETLTHLGTAQIPAGHNVEAERSLSEAAEILRRSLGGNHPLLAAVYAQAGTNYGLMQRHIEEREALERAHRISREALGRDHPFTADQENNLAVHYIRMRSYAQAESLEREAVEVWRHVHGEAHPNVIIGYQNLGYIEYCRERLARARDWFLRSIEVMQRQASQDVASPFPYSNLAGVYVDMGRPDLAEPLARRAVAIRPRDPAFRATLARVQFELGALDSAASGFRSSALESDRRAPGTGNHAWIGVALVLARQGHREEADSLLRVHLTTFLSSEFWPADKRYFLRRLVRHYTAQGRVSLADRCRAALASIPR